MNEQYKKILCEKLQVKNIQLEEEIQSLWSGYGTISRYTVGNESVVIKAVTPPNEKNHPRGWNSNASHNRKIKSYEVELQWYEHWANLCDENCYIPHCLATFLNGEEFVIALEDLDSAGFPVRKDSVSWEDIQTCIRWLAFFHGRFMGKRPEGLWEIGTYWHLATRPDELDVLDDISLKESASQIDTLLKTASFQTIVHGDAKLANFCFSSDGKNVSAVDFQYVGGGCGMKDLAYFVGSCLNEDDCEKMEQKILDYYFDSLTDAVKLYCVNINAQNVEEQWRPLYRVAWADFHRFLKGWSPGHWKINSYSERVTREVVDKISRGDL